MGKYARDREALASLVGAAEVHRDVFVDDEVFALEMRPSLREHLGLRRARERGGGARRLRHHRDRHPPRHHGAGRGRRDPRPPQPLPPQGHPAPDGTGRQHRPAHPLPLPRLDLPDGRVRARDSASPRLRGDRARGAGRPRRGSPRIGAVHNLPRLRLRPRERGRDRFRRVLRGVALQPRQHGRPLAGRAARGGGAAPSLPPSLQLEDAGREPDRCLPPDGRPRVLGGDRGAPVGGDAEARGHEEADGDGGHRPLRLALRVLRGDGDPRLAERPRPHRGAPLDPLRLLRDPRLLRAHGGGLGRGAGARDPRREPAQHDLLPEHDGEGADPAPSQVPAAGCGPHPRRELRVPAGWTPRICSSSGP